MKTCAKCKIEKPKSEFHNRPASKDGLHVYCKECNSIAAKNYRKANPEKIKEIATAYNLANPEKIKSSKDKYRANNKDKLKISSANYYLQNKDEIIAKQTIYQTNHKDEVKIRKADYEKRSAVSISARKKIYYEKTKITKSIKSAIYYIENKELIKAVHAAYRKANPDYGRIKSQNRRAKKKANGGKLSKGLRLNLFTLQRGCCAICKKKLDKLTKLQHLDHIIAVTLGGANEDWNMQLLCARCNLTKAAKDNIKHMQSLGYLL